MSREFHALARRMLTSFSVDEMLLQRYENWLTNFRGFLFTAEKGFSCLKRRNFILFAFTQRPMLRVKCTRVCSRDSSLVEIFVKSPRSSESSASIIFSVGYRLCLAFFLVWNRFLLLDLLNFGVRSLSNL